LATELNSRHRGVFRSLRVRYLALFDLLLIWFAILLALLLRLEQFDEVWSYLQNYAWPLLLIVPAVRLPLYYAQNLYNRMWRYASTAELRSIIQVGASAPLAIGLINFVLLPALHLPYTPSYSVWLLEALCSVSLLAASRMAMRILQQRAHGRKSVAQGAVTHTPRQTTLIVGAGDAGAMALREILRNGNLGMQVIGLVDDDASKHQRVLLGVPVLGNCRMIPDLVRQHAVSQVIIAMPTASGKVIRQVVQLCKEVNITPRMMPSFQSLVSGSINFNNLRPVDIDDLLRREPIVTNTAGVHKLLRNKRVLVTGGGGSIGSELCRQILHSYPAELIILGHGENSVFEIEQELAQLQQSLGSAIKLTTCIADVRMSERILSLFRHHRPEVVFHTAAHKHVPLMEANPGEAVTNNIVGTRNLLQAAQECDVQHFIMVSSDKAVNPTNVMGATKRGAELLVLDAARHTGKPYLAVRFGNVLGSRGSVVLTFKRQIAMGGPVTITDKRVERFFMTIPEAVQLMLQAAVLGEGGEVFMLDMGEPVRIYDLASDLIRLSGLEVERDIDIVYSGLRPGEKLFEELFLPGETYHTTAHPKIRIAADAGRAVPANLHHMVMLLESTVNDVKPTRLLEYLGALVPEYKQAKHDVPVASAAHTPEAASRITNLQPVQSLSR
jgi:FlaA1/EpsC-like NDP-sugar epimerase